MPIHDYLGIICISTYLLMIIISLSKGYKYKMLIPLLNIVNFIEIVGKSSVVMKVIYLIVLIVNILTLISLPILAIINAFSQ